MKEKVLLGVIFILLLIYIFYDDSTNIYKEYYYFDNNGTTMPSQNVMKAYKNNAYLGNPSASYATIAKKVIEDTKNEIYKWVGASIDYKILFTSCGSESINFYITSLVAEYNTPIHILTTAAEHKTTIECYKLLAQKNKHVSITIMPVHDDSTICGECAKKYIKENTILFSIIHGNNETGAINPISEIIKSVKSIKKDIKVHIDAVQTFGKLHISLPKDKIDALSFSAHKFNGPSGIGGLIFNNGLNAPLICGTQQYGLRGGTENIAGIAALKAAIIEMSANRDYKNELMQSKIQYIYDTITSPSIKKKYGIYTPNPKEKLPNTLLISFISKNFCNIKFKKCLLDRKVIVSIGSVCNTTSKNSSHVLDAMNLSHDIKKGMIRISVGDKTSWWDTYKMAKIFYEELLKFPL